MARGLDLFHGSTDKKDTDKKSGETETFIRGLCVGCSQCHTSKQGIQKRASLLCNELNECNSLWRRA